MPASLRWTVVAAVVVSAGLAARGLAGDPPRAGDPPAVPETPSQTEIDAAVARGVKWLTGERKRDGSFGTGPGETALALLALRHSEVPADAKPCRRAASFLERSLPDGTVYGASLGIVALLAQNRELHRNKIEELVGDLVAGQCKNGQWSYTYRVRKKSSSGDNSNTQFAVLALGAARTQRFEVPVEPFRQCRKFLEDSQNADGGFGYSAKERARSYAAMTAGGAMMLAFCHAAEERVPPSDAKLRAVPSVKRALDWLGERFDPASNTGSAAAFGRKKGKRSDSFWKHYWLWSVERACAVTGAETLGGHDWYAEGARHLLDRQRKDGGWRNPEAQRRATCFALLFFGRSTRKVLTPRDPPPAVTPR